MESFIAIIKEIIDYFEELALVEQQKLHAVTENRMGSLEDAMKKEQAFIMRLKGLDRKREIAQESLSFKGLTFKEIIQSTSGEFKDILTKLSNDLDEAVENYRSINENSRTALEVNLHSVEGILDKLQDKAQANNSKAYTGKGSLEKKPQTFSSKKV